MNICHFIRSSEIGDKKNNVFLCFHKYINQTLSTHIYQKIVFRLKLVGSYVMFWYVGRSFWFSLVLFLCHFMVSFLRSGFCFWFMGIMIRDKTSCLFFIHNIIIVMNIFNIFIPRENVIQFIVKFRGSNNVKYIYIYTHILC